MCITQGLHALKGIVFDLTGIVANVSQDGESSDLTWWDAGVFNSLTVWPDNGIHFSQHFDGNLLREARGAVSYLHDEIVWEWYQDGARCALSVWPDDSIWLFVSHKAGQLIRTAGGTLTQ